MWLIVFHLLWYLMVSINGQIDPLCDTCYKLELREIKDKSFWSSNSGGGFTFYPRTLFRYYLQTCDFVDGTIIIGSANATQRCGAKLKQIVINPAGFSTVKHTIRAFGPYKWRGIEIGLNPFGRFQIWLVAVINETAKIGYMSYSKTGKMKDIISCPVRDVLPDYCARTDKAFVYVGDDEIDIEPDDWQYLLTQSDIDEEQDDEEILLIHNGLISEENYDDYQVSIYLMIAAVIIIPIIVYFFIKWMSAKYQHKDYEQIPSDV